MPHVGRTYRLTGPVSQDMKAIAREFSLALGRQIDYVDVPLPMWKDKLSTRGTPAYVVSHLETMAKLHQDNRYDRYTDDVERLTGSRPMGVRAFVEGNAEVFASNAN